MPVRVELLTIQLELSGLWPGLTLAQWFLEDQRGEGGELDKGEGIGGC